MGLRCATIAPFLLVTAPALAQAAPTAVREVDFSVFAGVTETQTGLSQGRNAGVTVGADLNLPEVFHSYPAVEFRANRPYENGTVDAQRSVLGGVRIEGRIGRLAPYADLLGGSGQITFVRPYTLYSGQFLFSQPSSFVLSPGAGLRVSLTSQISLFGDFQLQRWSTPASLSGHLFAKPLTTGLVYRFALPQHRIRPGR